MAPLQSGQIISHRCRISSEEEKELDRYLILSVDGAWLRGYNLFTDSEIMEKFRDASSIGPGRVEQILISSIDSEEDTPNHFYWKIIS